jgi:hypothetical protein
MDTTGVDAKKSSTWISERTNERGMHLHISRSYIYLTEEPAALQNAFASDPKYKKYTQQVEKCLNSFDNVHEWADCIAFLKQLLKVRLESVVGRRK